MPIFLSGLIWYTVFVFSATIHEAAHAWAALRLGDPTASMGGQVSLDPVPHIRREPFGMVMLPLLSLVLLRAGIPIGYASAPYDPVWADYHPRRAGWMALAGPLANISIVLVCSFILWAGMLAGALTHPAQPTMELLALAPDGGGWAAVVPVVSRLASLNLILAVFNLLPVPPLDGYSVVGIFLPETDARRWRQLLAKPGFQIVGLMIAWSVFGRLYEYVFLFYLKILYPDIGYTMH